MISQCARVSGLCLFLSNLIKAHPVYINIYTHISGVCIYLILINLLLVDIKTELAKLSPYIKFDNDQKNNFNCNRKVSEVQVVNNSHIGG